MELLSVLTNVVGTVYIIFTLIFSPFQNSEPEVIPSCFLQLEGNGFANCTGNIKQTRCDITCDSRYQGRYICSSNNVWSPKLPYCAKSGKAELPSAQGSICSDVGKCNTLCEQIPAFRKLKGKCVGSKCTCVI
ncbi:hypothetical protein CDAR_213401 [Caerostris darwini]|uniref:Sushi domain-containing protein n=1 Tax=Caerostris darwini TaxID=1538125 RepID=A0AAV4QS84_9ARAC|nr:hypothetical protein CDAR_213401 [Caerostris darwini]